MMDESKRRAATALRQEAHIVAEKSRQRANIREAFKVPGREAMDKVDQSVSARAAALFRNVARKVNPREKLEVIARSQPTETTEET